LEFVTIVHTAASSNFTQCQQKGKYNAPSAAAISRAAKNLYHLFLVLNLKASEVKVAMLLRGIPKLEISPEIFLQLPISLPFIIILNSTKGAGI